MAKVKTPKVKSTKEKTPIEKEYDRLRSNLLEQRNRLLKEGFTFEKEPIPDKPKQIKESSIRNLQRTKERLLDKAQIKTASGEILTGRQYRNVKRWEASKKAAETRKKKKKPPVDFATVVITNYLAELNKWEHANKEKVRRNAGRVTNWILTLLEKNDKQTVARMIEQGAQDGLILTFEILYDDQLTDEYMTEMVRKFPGMTGEERDAMRKEIADEDTGEEDFMPINEDEELLFD